MDSLTLYHGTPISKLDLILKGGLKPRAFIAQLVLAYYYAAASAEAKGEPLGAVVRVGIPSLALDRLELMPDVIGLTEPVGFSQVNRQESLAQLKALGLFTEELEAEADVGDRIVEEGGGEEDLWGYLDGVGWPEPHEWMRSLVLIGSVATDHPIPPQWISVYDDEVDPSPLTTC